ncbi:DUF1206 domain-containing protein [Kitasatospora sp. NPDC057015]|uniref:DUF1206 domain-containing protein n=1 Tax=Kitasatospora sp. NPDC057015 TaxID=3346001 RepID=UPI003630F334
MAANSGTDVSLRARGRRWGRSPVVRAAGRTGFAARGVIYLLVGVLAARIALGSSDGKEADRSGAVAAIGEQPFGRVMLWALAAGFAGMAIWRLSVAVLGRGTGGDGPTGRAADLGRAAFNGFLCFGLVQSLLAGTGGPRSSNESSKEYTATVLGWPAGRWLVGAAGLAVIVTGVVLGVRAALRKFEKKLDTGAMGPRVRKAVVALGVVGGAVRGLVFAGAGVFVLLAALAFDPARAKGLDETLRSFTDTAAGPALLVAVGAGLALYGCFSFCQARWYRLR